MVLRLVVDTNVLFSIFKRDSGTRKIIYENIFYIELHSPIFAIWEMKEIKDEIIKKAKITEEEFYKILEEISEIVSLWPIEKYIDFLPIAEEITPDPDDIPFVALALKLNAYLWTNDKRLKEIKEIKVITTPELVRLLNTVTF
ncbi:PIN domain-containing protein [Pyrococcus kukulkanii]|uniref:PIN domain-containing protein n=1 Tax=Pyrococcus kukulkanii TaxID=1609559 RepID=UPI0035665139